MTSNVKKMLKEYLEAIGGIESVKKEDRIPLIKECVRTLNLHEKTQNLWPWAGLIKDSIHVHPCALGLDKKKLRLRLISIGRSPLKLNITTASDFGDNTAKRKRQKK
jgi:hypothetical protein